jgi:hypothetical protein
LQKPSTADRNWDVPLNANLDYLDGMTAIGGLVVTITETPSSSLNIRVSPGNYRRGDGTIGAFVGLSSLALPASATRSIWLTDSGVLTTGSAFPATLHVRLSSVTTGPSSILAVTDQRIQCESSGTGLGFILKTGDILPDGANLAFGSSIGTQIATSSTQKLGFFGATPSTQATGVAALGDSTGGMVSAGVTDVGTMFDRATINANFATLTARLNALIAAAKRNGLMAS